jgi:hypothetical protein
MADEKELKDQRVPVMMTPSELEAIDDWMFKNRIRSRGEAIRRLTATGMAVENSCVSLLQQIVRDMDDANDLMEKQAHVLAPLPEGEEISRRHALEIALVSMEAADKYEGIAWSTLERTSDLIEDALLRTREPLPKSASTRRRFTDILKTVRKALGNKSDE